ncbi:hypothetical protein TNCV_2647111 [Trichonephila clavipes]|nr:hypothetical protein TNCV_2647111 [Trichonephila clavipes]
MMGWTPIQLDACLGHQGSTIAKPGPISKDNGLPWNLAPIFMISPPCLTDSTVRRTEREANIRFSCKHSSVIKFS